MSLTLMQKQTLKTHIEANTTQLQFSSGLQQINTVFGQPSLDAGDANIIADHYNQPTNPAFYGFPSTVEVDDIIGATIGQNFNEYVSLNANAGITQLHHNAFDLLVRNGVIRPQNVEVRNALVGIFPAATASNTRSAILQAISRQANRVEQVLSSVGTGPGGGNGSSMTQSAILNFEGTVSTNDIQDLHGLPG